MVLKKWVFWLGMGVFILLGLSGCAQKKKTAGGTEEERICSEWYVNKCFTEDGILFKNPQTHRMEYYDYERGQYQMLCAKPNCTHETEECEAVYLAYKADFIGKVGESWCYFSQGENGECEFYTCALDGSDERRIGQFSHRGGTFVASKVIFTDTACLIATCEDVIDEETYDWAGSVISGIYRFDLRTGEETALCPDREEPRPAYYICGIYGNDLVYAEWSEGTNLIKAFNLDNGEQRMLTETGYAINAAVSDHYVVYCVQEGDLFRLCQIDLDTGEKTETEIQGEAGDIFWTEQLKLYVVYDQEVKGSSTYIYDETENKFRQIRRVTAESDFIPCKVKEDLLIGKDSEGMAVMPLEDYIAGSMDWTKL